MAREIAIIGAGIAGLTAAYDLKRRGYSVTVYEAEAYVGGRMSTDYLHDGFIDRGAQFLSPYYSTLMPLIEEIGLTSELIEITSDSAIVRGQKIRRISPERLFSPITSGYLSFREAFLFLARLAKWRKRLLQLPLCDNLAWLAFDDETAAQFISCTFGNVILEYLTEPQMQGYYYQSPEEVSKVQALLLLNFVVRKGKLLAFKKGLGVLPEKLATYLEVKLSCPIEKIEIDSHRKRVHLFSKQGSWQVDQVILATTASAARQLFPHANAIEQRVMQTRYSSTLTFHVMTSPMWSLPMSLQSLYGCLIPRRERNHIAAFAIENHKYKEGAPKGTQINFMVDGETGRHLLYQSKECILEKLQSEMEFYFPGIRQAISWSHVVHWPEALPIQEVGHIAKVKAYYDSLSMGSPIVLAGDYLNAPFTDAAAYSGRKAAEIICALHP